MGLCVLPPKYRGSKTASRLQPRSFHVAFLCYDIQSSGGVWVLVRNAHGDLKRICVLERDIRWSDSFAYNVKHDNLQLIRDMSHAMIGTSAAVPCSDDEDYYSDSDSDGVVDLNSETPSTARGGVDTHGIEILSSEDDDENEESKQNKEDGDEESVIHLDSSDDEAMNQARKAYGHKSAKSIKTRRRVQQVSPSRQRFLQARKVSIKNIYQAKLSRIAKVIGPQMVSKEYRKQFSKKQCAKAVTALFSMCMQDKEEMMEQAQQLLKDEKPESKAQCFALIVPSRQALINGSPGENDEERAKHREEWIKSITGVSGEVASLIEEGVLTLVPIEEVKPEDELLPSLMVLTLKSPDQSGHRRHKCRIVACGNFQKATGGDCFAPLIGRESWVPLLTMLVTRGFSCWQMDIRTAYLQTSPEDSVGTASTFMRRPWGAEGLPSYPDKSKVWRINKSIYGLKTAAAAWRTTLTKFIRSRGFRECKYDDSIYVSKTSQCVIMIYVDDVLFCGSKDDCKKEIAEMQARFKCAPEQELTDSNPILFLGHRIDFTVEDGVKKLRITQQEYVEDLIERFKLNPDKKPSLRPELFESEYLNAGKPLSDEDQSQLRSIIGALGYLATTRLDLVAPCCILAEGQSQGTSNHMLTGFHLLQFMASTKTRCLTFFLDDNLKPTWPTHFATHAYWDASFSVKSRSGLVLYVDGRLVYSRSKRQSTIALSSAEAELVACTLAGRELQGLTNMLCDVFDCPLENVQMSMAGDNQACNAIASCQAGVRRVRHLQLDHLWIRDLTRDGKVQLHWIGTNDNPADLLTKVIGPQKANDLWNQLLLKRSGGALIVA